MFKQFFFEAFGSERLAAPPAAYIASDFMAMIVDGDGLRISLYGQMESHVTWVNAVAVAVKAQSDIFVHESDGGIAVIRKERRV